MSNKSFQIPTFELDGAETQNRATRVDLLKATKLSRLPSLPKRSAFTLAPVCGNCPKRLDASDEFQTAVGFCKTCLRTYAVVGVGIEKYTESKIRRSYLEDK